MFGKNESRKKELRLKNKPQFVLLACSILLCALFSWMAFSTIAVGHLNGHFIVAPVAMFICAIYLARPILNRHPRLTIQDELFPGAKTVLDWKFKIRFRRVKQITITLVGTETARLSQVRWVEFTKHQIFRTSDASKMSSGSIPLEIPLNTMHSFKSPRVKISWSIIFNADIERWIDVNDVYELTMSPAPVEKNNAQNRHV